MLTEFSSALALKRRIGQVDTDLFASAHGRFASFAAAVSRLKIDDVDYAQAAAYCQRPELALRAGDAHHLAIASCAGCTLVTLDERMAKAAVARGVPVAEV